MKPASQTARGQRRWMRWLMVVALAVVILPFGLLVSCQSKLIYYPRPYGAGTVAKWQKEHAGKTVDYTTRQGKQRAFLQGDLKSPRNLWVFCAGNGTLALEWADWLATNAPHEDAWLLVDFPGYGDCEGYPSPGRIRANLEASIRAAAPQIGWTGRPDPSRLRFFGHSLGAASVMIAATDFQIQRGVLVSPFTSTMEMGDYMTHLPVGWTVWHRFDNVARIKELAERGQGKVIILHGTADTAIPISMSRKLKASQPNVVDLRELEGGDHNALPQTHRESLRRALEEIGR